MKVNLSLARDMAEQFQHQAEWRRGKAREHSDDAKRNLECAEQFEKMAQALDAFKGGRAYERWCGLLEADGWSPDEGLSQELASIHFVAVEPERLFEHIVTEAAV